MVHQRFMWPFSFSNARWGEYCDRADKKHSKICFFFLPKGRTQFNLVIILKFYNSPTECLYHVGRLKTTMLTIPHNLFG